MNLINWGFQPTDFAYPFADADTTETAAKASAATTAPAASATCAARASCRDCVYAETMPPPDPYYLRAPDEVDSTWTLAQMKAEVTNAQSHGGGWVILTFHHICSPIGAADCPSDLSTTPTIFSQFVTWLAGQASDGTTVKTVQQVIGGSFKPGGVREPAAPAAPGVNACRTRRWRPPTPPPGSRSATRPAAGAPTRWPGPTRAAAHTGTKSENLTVTNYSSGDAKLLPTLDLGACTPTVVPGNTYNLSVWYKSTAISQFALYYRTTNGTWSYWTSSPWFAAASTWTQATFTTPAVPAGANGVSFGLALIANGTLTTDDYSFVPGTAAKAPSGGPGGDPDDRRGQPITRGPRRTCTRTSGC